MKKLEILFIKMLYLYQLRKSKCMNHFHLLGIIEIVKSKIYLSVCLIMLVVNISQLSAQIGIKGGLNVSDIAFLDEGQSPYLGYEVDFLEHNLPAAGFQIGVFGEFPIFKRLEFQPELLIIKQGLNYSKNYIYDDITYKVRIYYLDVPALLKYNLSKKARWHPALLTGPYASLKLKGTRITKIDSKLEKTPISNLRHIDFGITAGIFSGFDLSKGQITIDFRCSYSLFNMMDRIDGYIPSYYGTRKEYARNVCMSLTVGYKFNNIWSNKDEVI
jgi:hypothetical protein